MSFRWMAPMCGLVCLGVVSIALGRSDSAALYFVEAKAATSQERTMIANAGIAIDAVFSDFVTFVATESEIASLKRLKIPFEIVTLPPERDFPTSDGAFHNFKETQQALQEIVAKHQNIARLITIGKSLEGRELYGVRLSSAPDDDSLPTAIFLGCHHAREHVSVEMPLMLAQYLVDNYATNPRIRKMIDTREIWIVPMVNPDGAEYDIASGSYKYWRKNRRGNTDGTYGVDLNRNYGTGFGGEGSSATPSSDIYHGPFAFSEPETAAVRDFVRARSKTTVLLSFHTFSELVLWPYGHTDEEIPDATDRKVFEKMGNQMATWNKYKPMKSSGLYLASGDTTDWAYEERKIFAFTFELSPSSMLLGGFYPGAKAILPTFQANLEPTLYLIEMAGNPYRALGGSRDPLGFLP